MKEVQTELDNLVSVSKWKVNPSLIIADDVAIATNHTSFDSTKKVNQ